MITGTNLGIAKQPKEPQFSWRGGDALILSPFGHMLREPWTKILLRFRCPLPILPFFSARWGVGKGFYVGWKGCGADKTYAAWNGPTDQDFLILTARVFSDG